MSDFFTEFKTKYHLCATQCCICHKTLTDPSSIEYGIGPICRKNGNYDDAPVLTDTQVKPLTAAIDAAFPPDAAVELTNKIAINSPTMTRQLARCTIYYASSIVGSKEAGRMIHCIRILICLGYDKLASRLLSKSYGHTVWPKTEDQKGEIKLMYYKGPFNKLINAYLKSQFKGHWDTDKRQWSIEGKMIDCMAMLVAAQVGDLPSLPSSPPIKIQLKKLELGDSPPFSKELPPLSLVQTLKSLPPIKFFKKELPPEDKKPKIPITLKSKLVDDSVKISMAEKKDVETFFPAIKLALTEKTIAVTSPFNLKFKTAVKTQLGGKWDANTKQWVVDIAKMTALKTLLNESYPNFPIQLV